MRRKGRRRRFRYEGHRSPSWSHKRKPRAARSRAARPQIRAIGSQIRAVGPQDSRRTHGHRGYHAVGPHVRVKGPQIQQEEPQSSEEGHRDPRRRATDLVLHGHRCARGPHRSLSKGHVPRQRATKIRVKGPQSHGIPRQRATEFRVKGPQSSEERQDLRQRATDIRIERPQIPRERHISRVKGPQSSEQGRRCMSKGHISRARVRAKEPQQSASYVPSHRSYTRHPTRTHAVRTHLRVLPRTGTLSPRTSH